MKNYRNFNSFKKELLADKEIKKAYDDLWPEYALAEMAIGELPSRTIWIRLPVYLINLIKLEAARLNIPYKDLIIKYLRLESLKQKRSIKKTVHPQPLRGGQHHLSLMIIKY